jgi:opacity protein-like surface antigen
VPESRPYGCTFLEDCSSTYDETDFAWNVGGGLRWNVTDHFVLKLVGGLSWTELKDSDDLAQFGFVTLSIGGSF